MCVRVRACVGVRTTVQRSPEPDRTLGKSWRFLRGEAEKLAFTPNDSGCYPIIQQHRNNSGSSFVDKQHNYA